MGHQLDRREKEVLPTVNIRRGLGSARTPITVIHAVGAHDYASRGILAAALDGFEGHVVVDLTRCTFVDSSVIGQLLGKALELGKGGFRLELVVPRSAPLARKVARLGLQTFIPGLGDMPSGYRASTPH